MKTIDDTILTQNQAQALVEIKNQIKEKFKIENIILYGSIVRGDFDEESNIAFLTMQ